MANSPDTAFQKVLKAAIDTALPTVSHGANPPHSEDLPYIWYGESEVSTEVVGHRLALTVRLFSSAQGPHVVKSYMQAIRDALHLTGASQDGWTLVCIQDAFSDIVHDIDNQHWQGVMRLEALASEE